MAEAISGAAPQRRAVAAGRGKAWWTESWALFKKSPGMWVLYAAIFLAGSVILSHIAIVGSLVGTVLTVVIMGSWMLAARKLEAGEALEVADLFAGFKDKVKPLLILGFYAAGASVAIFFVMVVIGGGAMLTMVSGMGNASMDGMMPSFGVGALSVLVALALTFLMSMALWFAPPLIVFDGLTAQQAVKASWSASRANIAPFTIHGLLWIVAAIVASILLMLGWLVLVPLTMLAMYFSYRDIFSSGK
ncbi:MAG TPA: BPSS1780 family membrane protein [Ramlibacter sp.]|nr:BPSS1780 family membrane protein [Ramlibacter sp.]